MVEFKALEMFSRAPSWVREREGNILYPLHWGLFVPKVTLSWQWDSRDPTPSSEGNRSVREILGALATYEVQCPTASFEVDGLEAFQARVQVEGNVSRYLTVFRQSDIEKVGISKVLTEIETIGELEEGSIPLPTVGFGIYDMWVLADRFVETRNEGGDLTMGPKGLEMRYEKPNPHVEKKADFVPLTLVFSEQNAPKQPLEHQFVAFITKASVGADRNVYY